MKLSFHWKGVNVYRLTGVSWNRRFENEFSGEMKDIVRNWLVKKIGQIDSVRGSAVNRQGFIVAVTWSGTIVHIYLLDEIVKPRALKKIIQDNTRVGVGSMFIIDARLAPQDGIKTDPGETLLALHMLFKDRLYTCRIDESGQPTIGQVHFKSFGRANEYEVWYGPDVDISHLPSYRAWIRHPNSMKGDWLMANFGSDSFWKQPDYSAGREAFRQRVRNTQRYSWSKTTNGSGRLDSEDAPPQNNGASPRVHARNPKLERSYAELGLTGVATNEEVRSAFRNLARTLHPDVSQLPKDEAERKFKAVSEAYTFIKLTKGW